MLKIITTITSLALAAVAYKLYTTERELSTIKQEMPKKITQAREDSVKKSHNVIRGKVTEELVSLIPGFTGVASDFKFFGSPFDYIHLKGMSALRDGEADHIEEIVFIDVKTGKARLSPVEKGIREAVASGKVSWETWNITDKGIDVKPFK